MTAILLLASVCAGQAAPAEKPPTPWAQEMQKYPGLLPEIGRLMEELQREVRFPAARAQSRLLPLLPASTVIYAALPNYGEAMQQALAIFHGHLKQSPSLRAWYGQGEAAKTGAALEEALEKAYRVSQYLGEEVVISGASGGKEPKLLIVAEVRKPGLKPLLQQMLKEAGAKSAKSKPPVRVLDLQELAKAAEGRPGQQLLLLVRPDYVVGALDMTTLRDFNARLEGGRREFASTAFGQRVAQAYQGGANLLAAADLQTILGQLPPPAKQDPSFQRSGFSELKYLVWEHKGVAGQPAGQMELSFTGPRHGMASWLAPPGRMGSLEFVSPKALMAGTLMLNNPAQIFEDVKAMATASNPNAFAPVNQMQQAFKVSLKDDLLSLLGGEVTFEMDDPNPAQPVWKAILRVNDPPRLQQTLTTLMTAMHFAAQQILQDGVTYHAVQVPSGKKTTEIGYVFADGYLVIGSSREAVAEAVRLHKSGESLGKSQKFLASLPPGHSPEASALLYQDPMAMMAARLRMLSPEIAAALSQQAGEVKPAVVCAYGEPTAIRQVSTSATMDVGAVLLVAAIAIPNLLRSRMAANEASAVGTLRTINVAQVTYASTYPERGFARELAMLGMDPGGAASAERAGLIDTTQFSGACAAGAWCTKSGYRFSMRASCIQQQCGQYVAVGTPAEANAGTKSFCSASDGVIRFQAGPPLTSMVTVTECRAWTPIQ